MIVCRECGTEAWTTLICPDCGARLPHEAGSSVHRVLPAGSGPAGKVRRLPARALVSGCAVVLLAAGAFLFVASHSKDDPEAAPPTHVLRGTMKLDGAADSGDYICGGVIGPGQISEMLNTRITQPCPAGLGGHDDDIRDGTQVTVSDDRGHVLGVGRLQGGTYDGGNLTVTWTFEVADLPERSLYSIEVAHRGGSLYGLSVLRSNDWTIPVYLSSVS